MCCVVLAVATRCSMALAGQHLDAAQQRRKTLAEYVWVLAAIAVVLGAATVLLVHSAEKQQEASLPAVAIRSRFSEQQDFDFSRSHKSKPKQGSATLWRLANQPNHKSRPKTAGFSTQVETVDVSMVGQVPRQSKNDSEFEHAPAGSAAVQVAEILRAFGQYKLLKQVLMPSGPAKAPYAPLIH
eukprot:g2589.t1